MRFGWHELSFIMKIVHEFNSCSLGRLFIFNYSNYFILWYVQSSFFILSKNKFYVYFEEITQNYFLNNKFFISRKYR